MTDLDVALGEALAVADLKAIPLRFSPLRLVNITGRTPELLDIRASLPPATQNRPAAPFHPW